MPKKSKKQKVQKKAKGTSRSARIQKKDSHSVHSVKFLFLIKFFLSCAILVALINILDLSFFTALEAALVGWLTGSMVQGSTIVTGTTLFVVTNNCLGLVSAAILAALLYAFPRPSVREKVSLFLIGAILILLANIPRVWLVVWSAQQGIDPDPVHVISWFVMSAVVLLVWYKGMRQKKIL